MSRAGRAASVLSKDSAVLSNRIGAVSAEGRSARRNIARMSGSLQSAGRAALGLSSDVSTMRGRLTAAKRELSSAGREARGLGRGLSSAGRDMLGVIDNTTILGNRLSALSGEFGDVSRSARAASVSLGVFSASAWGASAAVGAIKLGALVTSAGLLLTTLGPLAAALGVVAGAAGGLAAAFGAVMATGLFAWTEKVANKHQRLHRQAGKARAAIIQEAGGFNKLSKAQKKQVKHLKKQMQYHRSLATNTRVLTNALEKSKKALKQNAMQLGRKFIPLMRSAVNALPKLINKVFAALGPMKQFRNELRRLGRVLMRVIPGMVGGMMDLARTALPVFTRLTKWFGNKVPQAIGVMNRAVRKTGPVWTRMLGATIRLLPPLMRLGTQVTKLVGPAFTALLLALKPVVSWLTRTFRAVNRLKPQFMKSGVLIMKRLVPAFRTLGRVVSGIVPVARRAYRTVERGARVVVRFFRSTLLPAFQTVFGGVSRVLRDFERTGERVSLNVRKALTLLKKDTGRTIQSVRRSFRRAKKAFRNQLIKPARNTKREFSRNLREMKREARDTFLLIQKVVTQVGTALVRTYQKHIRSLVRLTQRHLSGPNGILANARTAFNALWGNIVQPILAAMERGWAKWGDEITTIVDGTFSTVLSVIRWGLDTILTAINVTLDLLSGDVEGAFDSIGSYIKRTINGVARWLQGTGADMLSAAGSMLAEKLKGAYNAVMPDSFGVPSITIPRASFSVPGLSIAGHQIYDRQSVGVGPFGPFGGQSVDIPHLDTGGFIQSAGLAMVHAGERVVKAANVDRDGGVKGSGGGGDTYIEIHADSYEGGQAAARGFANELRSFNFD